MNAEQKKPAGNVTSQMARGVAWMMLLKLAVRSLGLVSTLILVRLLTPQDFGLVAMAMVFIAIMDVFSWFSFDVVLIQKQNATRKHYDTAWTFNVIFKSISALILLAIAYPAAIYYQDSRVTPLIIVLAAGMVIEAFENIGIVNFRKNMEFDKEFRFMFLRKFSGFIVTVPLAFLLRSYWALIIGTMSSKVFTLAMSYYLQEYRPRFSLAARGELFNFSKWLFLNNIFFAIRMRSVELILGRMTGARNLGLFTISREISNLPTTELIAPINRAVFPGYAKIASDMARLRKGYLDVMSVIAMFAVPAAAGIAATAPVLVPVALGSQWLEATPLIEVLAMYGMVAALQTNIASVYMAIGKPYILTALHGSHLVLLLAVTIPVTIRYGIHGAALAYLGTSLFLLPVNYAVMFRTIGLTIGAFVARVWRPLAATLAMYFAVARLTVSVMEQANATPHVGHLLVLVIAGALFYTAAVAVLWWLSGRPDGAESYVLRQVRDRLRKRRSAAPQPD